LSLKKAKKRLKVKRQLKVKKAKKAKLLKRKRTSKEVCLIFPFFADSEILERDTNLPDITWDSIYSIFWQSEKGSSGRSDAMSLLYRSGILPGAGLF